MAMFFKAIAKRLKRYDRVHINNIILINEYVGVKINLMSTTKSFPAGFHISINVSDSPFSILSEQKIFEQLFI